MFREKYMNWLVPGIVLIILVGLIFVTQPKEKALGNADRFDSIRKTLTATDEVPYWNTETNNNLVWVGSATTTYTMDVANVDTIHFNIFTKGTTTVSTNVVTNLVWFYQFTQASSTTNGTWFGEDASSSSGNAKTHTSDQQYHFVNFGQISSSTRQVILSDINAKYLKIGFNAGTTTTPYLGVFIEAIYKKGN